MRAPSSPVTSYSPPPPPLLTVYVYRIQYTYSHREGGGGYRGNTGGFRYLKYIQKLRLLQNLDSNPLFCASFNPWHRVLHVYCVRYFNQVIAPLFWSMLFSILNIFRGFRMQQSPGAVPALLEAFLLFIQVNTVVLSRYWL